MSLGVSGIHLGRDTQRINVQWPAVHSEYLPTSVKMLLLRLCFLFGITTLSSGVNRSNLYFGVFISQRVRFDFSGFIPPLELGVETINNSTYLKDYFINYLPIANAKVKYYCSTVVCMYV